MYVWDTAMTAIVLVESNGSLKSLKAKDLSEATLFKKCGFRNADHFQKRTSWTVNLNGIGENNITVSLWAKDFGKSNYENKYELPAFANKTMYYGPCTLVRTEGSDIVDLPVELWQQIYNQLVQADSGSVSGSSSITIENIIQMDTSRTTTVEAEANENEDGNESAVTGVENVDNIVTGTTKPPAATKRIRSRPSKRKAAVLLDQQSVPNDDKAVIPVPTTTTAAISKKKVKSATTTTTSSEPENTSTSNFYDTGTIGGLELTEEPYLYSDPEM